MTVCGLLSFSRPFAMVAGSGRHHALPCRAWSQGDASTEQHEGGRSHRGQIHPVGECAVAASITRWTIEATAGFLLAAVGGPLTSPAATAVTTPDRYGAGMPMAASCRTRLFVS